jgi:hypothetical protein
MVFVGESEIMTLWQSRSNTLESSDDIYCRLLAGRRQNTMKVDQMKDKRGRNKQS